MSALSLMVVSNNPHPDMLESEMTLQHGSYRWYKVNFPKVSFEMLQEVLNTRIESFDELMLSGARIDDSGIELAGTVMVSRAALKTLREMNAALLTA
jgi:hypothetical protein